MPELLTLQDLANGHLDVKALGEAANGDEDTIVTTRTGNTYPSAERAINIMFKNGGLPAEPFETFAKMETDGVSLPDGQLAMVYNETANNGLYIKTAGSWVKSAHDPLTSSKNYTNKVIADEVKVVLFSDNETALFQLRDSNSNIIAEIDGDSQLRLVGMNDSIQDLGANITPLIYSVGDNDSEDLAVLVDSEGKVVLRVASDGGLSLAGLEDTVQNSLKNFKSRKPVIGYDIPTNMLLPDVAAKIAYLVSLNKTQFKPPASLLQQDYTANIDDYIKTLDLSHPVSHTPIDAFEDKGSATNWVTDAQVVHPCVIELDEPMLGYKYWLAITPYQGSSEDLELPYIYGTNDDNLAGWELIEGLPKPFDVDPVVGADESLANSGDFTSGHLSDPVFVYDPNEGELWLVWRRNLYYEGGRDRTKAKLSLWGRKTKDGINWSEKISVLDEYLDASKDIIASPSILYDANEACFKLYSINNSKNSYIYMRKTAKLGHGVWTEPKEVYAVTSEFDPYHLEAKFVGTTIVILVQDYLGKSFRFLCSEDGESFDEGKILLKGIQTYKGSFLTKFDEIGQMYFKVIYTSGPNSSPVWRLYVSDTTPKNK